MRDVSSDSSARMPNTHDARIRAIHRASRDGDLEVVQALLAAGVCVRYDDWSLEYASQNGHLEIVQVLLAAGASVLDACNQYSALSLACSNGHAKIAELLIAAGSHVCPDSMALSNASENGHVQ